MDWKIFDPANGTMILPDSLGIYIVSFKDLETLPCKMRHLIYAPVLREYPVMYIGKSGEAGISRRYQDHFLETARNSTLRKSLGVLFEYRRHYYPDRRYRFDERDEERLSVWMKENLIFIYCIVADPDVDGLETSQIEQYHPPLNLRNNTSEINRDFRNILIRLRNDFRDRDTAETLIDYCRENGRVCPQPLLWHKLFQILLDNTHDAGERNAPSVPLILGGWEADNELKQERLAAHIRWAEQNNCIDEISQFLRDLREEDWFYGWGQI